MRNGGYQMFIMELHLFSSPQHGVVCFLVLYTNRAEISLLGIMFGSTSGAAPA